MKACDWQASFTLRDIALFSSLAAAILEARAAMAVGAGVAVDMVEPISGDAGWEGIIRATLPI